jgi:hypothetical protein
VEAPASSEDGGQLAGLCHFDFGQQLNETAGGQSVGATPVPIPNTVVKPYSADGTPLERARESRPPPASHFNRLLSTQSAGACCR